MTTHQCVYIISLSLTGLLCDLLWADPDKETVAWGENDRGVSFTFGPEIVSKFLCKHDLDLICRAHQVQNTSIICTTEVLIIVMSVTTSSLLSS